MLGVSGRSLGCGFSRVQPPMSETSRYTVVLQLGPARAVIILSFFFDLKLRYALSGQSCVATSLIAD